MHLEPFFTIKYGIKELLVIPVFRAIKTGILLQYYTEFIFSLIVSYSTQPVCE